MTSSQHGYLRPGLHTRYNGRYRGLRRSDPELIPESRPQLGLQAETRLHERGVASNRRSAHHAVNTFSGLVHTARQVMEVGNT